MEFGLHWIYSCRQLYLYRISLRCAFDLAFTIYYLPMGCDNSFYMIRRTVVIFTFRNHPSNDTHELDISSCRIRPDTLLQLISYQLTRPPCDKPPPLICLTSNIPLIDLLQLRLDCIRYFVQLRLFYLLHLLSGMVV